jgi:hypothetical protein
MDIFQKIKVSRALIKQAQEKSKGFIDDYTMVINGMLKLLDVLKERDKYIIAQYGEVVCFPESMHATDLILEIKEIEDWHSKVKCIKEELK